MKKLFLLLTFLLTSLVLPANAQTTDMFGVRSRTMATATVSKTIVLPSSANKAWIQLGNASAPFGQPNEEKAALRINGGSWISLVGSNNDIDCDSFFDELSHDCFGMQSGVTSFMLSNITLNSGSNTVEWRVTPNQISQNFYVLAFVPVNGSTKVTPTTDMDISETIVTSSSSGNASTGAALWNARNSLVEYYGGHAITSSCQDCHTTNGKDDLLQASFTDASIVDRSMYHGLTEQQGRDIAAHIRAQTRTNDDGSTQTVHAQPMHPPYQPGPGMSEGTTGEWINGVGLDGVLKTTDAIGRWYQPTYEQKRNGLFPNGMNEGDWTNQNASSTRAETRAIRWPSPS